MTGIPKKPWLAGLFHRGSLGWLSGTAYKKYSIDQGFLQFFPNLGKILAWWMEFRHDCFWIVRILRIVVSNRKLINPYFITQKHNWHDLSVWEKNASSSGISWSQDFLGQLSEGVRYTWNPNDPCFDWNFGLVLGGWPSQIEVIWVPGIYIRPRKFPT